LQKFQTKTYPIIQNLLNLSNKKIYSKTIKRTQSTIKRENRKKRKKIMAKQSPEKKLKKIHGHLTKLNDQTEQHLFKLYTVEQNIHDIRKNEIDEYSALVTIQNILTELQNSIEPLSHTHNILETILQNISEITTSIENIANKINLLAINTAIIADKHKHKDEGLGVVAQEMRVLSDETKFSAERIKKIITQTHDTNETPEKKEPTPQAPSHITTSLKTLTQEHAKAQEINELNKQLINDLESALRETIKNTEQNRKAIKIVYDMANKP